MKKPRQEQERKSRKVTKDQRLRRKNVKNQNEDADRIGESQHNQTMIKGSQ